MFENQVIIVTGGASGIGLGCVEKFLDLGATVVIADIDEKNGNALTEQYKTQGKELHYIATDVSDYQQVEKMCQQAASIKGQIHVLVNSAGMVTEPAYCTDMENEKWLKMLEVHLTGTFYCTKTAAREMQKFKYGRIINLSSLASPVGLTGNCHYAAVKGGVISFTYALAKELAPYGITINAVQPGLIRSAITAPFLAAGEQSLAKETPVGRIGEPEDVANAVAYLASPGSGFVTGTDFRIDGGYMLNCGLDQLMQGAMAQLSGSG